MTIKRVDKEMDTQWECPSYGVKGFTNNIV